MSGLQTLCVFLGRVFLSSIFILSSFSDIMDWSATEQYLGGSLTNIGVTGVPESSLVSLAQTLLPWTSALLALAIVLKMLGGFLVLIGWKVRFGAVLLIMFLVPTTFLMHAFWIMPQGPDRMMQMIMFMKNVSIFGGLLLLLAFGKGGSKKACPVEKV